MRDYKLDNSDWQPNYGRRKGGGSVWKTLIVLVLLGGAGYAGFDWYQTQPRTEAGPEASTDPRIVPLQIPPLKAPNAATTTQTPR